MNTFQTHMNQYPAPGIPGAFASDNPHASYVAGEGALIAGQQQAIKIDGITRHSQHAGIYLYIFTEWDWHYQPPLSG